MWQWYIPRSSRQRKLKTERFSLAWAGVGSGTESRSYSSQRPSWKDFIAFFLLPIRLQKQQTLRNNGHNVSNNKASYCKICLLSFAFSNQQALLTATKRPGRAGESMGAGNGDRGTTCRLPKGCWQSHSGPFTGFTASNGCHNPRKDIPCIFHNSPISNSFLCCSCKHTGPGHIMSPDCLYSCSVFPSPLENVLT